MKIVLFYRKPYHAHWSIEQIFKELAVEMRKSVEVIEKVSPFYSHGLWPRLRALYWTFQQRSPGSIYHITGDVHFLVFALPRKQTILTIHDLAFLERGNYLSRFVLWLVWVYLPVIWVGKITTVSEETKMKILHYTRCSPEKVTVIPNFLKKDFSQVKKEFNAESPVILQIGTMYNKNLDRVVEAMKGIPCHFRIIGRLSQKQLTLLRDSKIEFSNAYDLTDEALQQEYVRCDLVTFCSLVEGFGLPIIEAQAIGRPVITSNLSSMPEIAGEGAHFIDPTSVVSIKEGLQRIINDFSYREILISKGLKNVLEFELSSVSNKYLNVYRIDLKE